MSCAFCKSEKITLETPYVKLDGFGKYVPEKKYCCNAQKKNQQYVQKRFDPSRGRVPEAEEVSRI